MVRVGNYTSFMPTFNMGDPQGCVLSPLLYSLFTHDCVATHDYNTIIKFADYTTVVSQITDDDELVYREEVRDIAVLCQDKNLSLIVSKTKELIVDYRRKRGENAIHINGAVVERVESFKFLGAHISKDLTWSTHTRTVVKMAHHSLFPLRRLKRFGMGPRILKTFYSCTIESILTGCITA